MEYRSLGKSGLKVSEIGLGCNSFGTRVDSERSITIIQHALELGISFIDTADMYGQGRSEELVGEALGSRRSQVVIATKFGHPRTLGPGQQGGSRSHVVKSVDASLRRLRTDYIDLFYFHHPDADTAIEETLRALDDLVRAGKVRYIGCSNFAAWQLCEALWTSRLRNLESFVAVQSRYNLLDRAVERELVPCCEAYGVGLIPWGPLASGFLSGKYRRGHEIPASMRLASPPPIYADVVTEANFDKLTRLESFAKERGHTVIDLGIAWLLSHAWLGSVIAGATSVEHLSANAGASAWKLSAEDLIALDTILV